MPSPALITPLPLNAIPNILAANVPNSIGGNPPFCSFVSFLIVSLIYFTSNPNSLSDLTILIISPFHHLKLLRLLYMKLSPKDDLIHKFSFT